VSPNVKDLWLFSDLCAARNSNMSGLMWLLAILSTQMSGLSSWSVCVDFCWLWHMDWYFSDYPVFLTYSSIPQRRHKI